MVLALLLAGCTSDPPEPQAATSPTPSATSEQPTPTPTATPTPTPTPELEPVKGKRVRHVRSVSSDRMMGLGSAASPNDKAVNRAMGQVANWLDRHLDHLQRTGNGRWGQVAPKGLANGKQRRPATIGLASPERPVASARYELTAFHDGAPEMVTVDVVVQHPEGRPSRLFFVFTMNRKGNPVLRMFGPPPPREESA